MSHSSQGLLFNWPKAAVEEGVAFAFPGSSHCKVSHWVCRWAQGLARVLSHFEVELGDGNCQNDYGEMSNTDIVLCIKSLLSNLEETWKIQSGACHYGKDILAVITMTLQAVPAPLISALCRQDVSSKEES